MLFLPQVVAAIAGSLALPALARRFRLKRALLAGLIADTLAMSLLAGSYPFRAGAAAYPMLLLATASWAWALGSRWDRSAPTRARSCPTAGPWP